MLSKEKEDQKLVKGLQEFEQKNHRKPSLRELGKALGWRKSIVERVVNRCLAKGVLRHEEGVSKSLQVVK